MENQIIVQNNGSAEWNLDGTCRSTEIPVMILNPTGGKSAAVQNVIDNVPSSVDGLPLSYVRFDDYDSDGNMNMVAIYNSDGTGSSNSENEPDEESVISINGGGGTAHITEALGKQELVYSEFKTNPDPGTKIGWNGESGDGFEVTGVDIVAPNCRLVITKKIAASKLTTLYLRKLLKKIGTVNNAPFKGWDKGEVLFEDFSFSAPENAAQKVDVTFNFAIQMNEKNYSYAGRSISKEGWQYVWGMPRPWLKIDGQPSMRTVAYKCQIYPYGNFNELGL